MVIHADSKDWADAQVAGYKCHFVGFVMRWLKCAKKLQTEEQTV